MFNVIFVVVVVVVARVQLIARSWDPGLEEVETKVGNGRKWERERGRERGKKLLLFAK